MMIKELSALLTASRATPAFRDAVLAYDSRQTTDRVTAAAGCPRVKVLRAVTQLLHTEPTLTVDRIHVNAVSGCADFVGTLTVTDHAGALHNFDFNWNCEWKAHSLGYLDGFGLPDQIRAAQEFDWRCFERWDRIPSGVEHVA